MHCLHMLTSVNCCSHVWGIHEDLCINHICICWLQAQREYFDSAGGESGEVRGGRGDGETGGSSFTQTVVVLVSTSTNGLLFSLSTSTTRHLSLSFLLS